MSDAPDAFLGGILRLHQPQRGAHRAGTDAVLLARWLAPAVGERLCDVGAGTGAVGLVCAALTPGSRHNEPTGALTATRSPSTASPGVSPTSASEAPSAQRTAALRLTEIEMPMPDPHSAIPRSAVPSATTSDSL